MDRNHGHQHPQEFIQDERSRASQTEVEEARCFACLEGVEGRPNYRRSSGCKFDLHKSCLEIKHPLHPQHPLVLLSDSPYSHKNFCNFCRQQFTGSAYHCASDHNCGFDLDIDCARLRLSPTEDFHQLKHPCHKQHPLIFNEKHNKKKEGYCEACRKKLGGSIYRCLESSCSFDLHKKCADELPSKINHTFHPEHHLSLLLPLKQNCVLCGLDIHGFAYGCDACQFWLDTTCARLQPSLAESYPKSAFHEHPLVLIDREHVGIIKVKGDCFGCRKPLSLPIYKCLQCCNFDLHKECGELDLVIEHPSDRKHALTLLRSLPTHPTECSCYLCQIRWKGFVYYCSHCNFGLTPDDVLSSPPEIIDETYEHAWILLSRSMSFVCDFCGDDGDRTPYLCTTCYRIVHKRCISLPSSIKITRHDHRLSHSYSLGRNQLEEKKCRICYKEVDAGYGTYSCHASDCNYIAHVNCATHKDLWDEKTKSKLPEGHSKNLITVIRKERLGEDEIATTIKHKHHTHTLILTSSGEGIKYNHKCDGCMRPISTPFYSCRQCDGFSLHKSCAELPEMKSHPSHKHELILRQAAFVCCTACNRFHHGFNYKCSERSCEFVLDVRCASLSDTLKHPSHEHPVFLDHNYHGNCNGCGNEMKASSSGSSLGYKCVEGCLFALDFSCLTLPLEATYKYDRHPLTLAHCYSSDPDQHYCDLCEEERKPNRLCYYCADCDNTLHPDCIIGELPFVKPGKKLKVDDHNHPLTFVENVWNCPRCNDCRNLCNLQALECQEGGCNFILHFKHTENVGGRKYFPIKVRRRDWTLSLMEHEVTISQMPQEPADSGEARPS